MFTIALLSVHSERVNSYIYRGVVGGQAGAQQRGGHWRGWRVQLRGCVPISGAVPAAGQAEPAPVPLQKHPL